MRRRLVFQDFLRHSENNQGPEQATYIVEHGGQLPPDVNEDVLYGGAEPSN